MNTARDNPRIVCLHIDTAVELQVAHASLPDYVRWLKGVEDTPIRMFVRPPGHLTLPDFVEVHNGALAFSPRVFEVFGPKFVAGTAPIECYGITGFRLGEAWSGTTTFRMSASFTYLQPLTLCHGAGDMDGRLFGSIPPPGRLGGLGNVFVSEATWARIVSAGLTGVRKLESVEYRPPPR